jgi:hypothetical protein
MKTNCGKLVLLWLQIKLWFIELYLSLYKNYSIQDNFDSKVKHKQQRHYILTDTSLIVYQLAYSVVSESHKVAKMLIF